MNKYTTKLTADTSQHDAALKKSANEVYKYNIRVDKAKKGFSQLGNSVRSGISSIGGLNVGIGRLAGGFGKLNPWVAAGGAALGLFFTTVKNNEGLLDGFKSNIEGINNAFREFTQDISSGNFANALSNFFKGLELGKNLYNADDARDTYMAFDEPAVNDARNKVSELRNEVMEAQLSGSKEAIDKAKKDFKAAEDELIKLLEGEQKKIADAKWAALFATIKPNKLLNKSTIMQYAMQYIGTGGAKWDEMVNIYNYKLASGLKKHSTAQMDFFTQAIVSENDLRDSEKGYLKYLKDEQNIQSEINEQRRLGLRVERMKASNISTGSTKTTKPITTKETKTTDELADLISQKKQELEKLKTQYSNNLVRLYTNVENKQIQNSLINLNKDLLMQIQLLSKDINNWEEVLVEAFNTVETSINPNSLTALEKLLKTLEENRLRRIEDDDVLGVQYYSDEIKKLEEQIKNKKIELGLIEPDKVEEDVKIIEYTIGDAYSAITNLYSSINSLGNAIGDAFDSDEIREFFNALQSGLNVINAVYSIFEAFNKVMEVSNVLKATSNTLTKEGTTAAAADIAVQTADASAKASGAIAGATAAGAWIPFPYNLIAIAGGIAAVVSALALMGNYADGGIISGNTTVGDHGLARVNAGEMILNSREQNRLWNVLNGASLNNGSIGGEVRFEIEGSRLVGVLNNYESKKGRIR